MENCAKIEQGLFGTKMDEDDEDGGGETDLRPTPYSTFLGLHTYVTTYDFLLKKIHVTHFALEFTNKRNLLPLFSFFFSFFLEI